MKKHERHKLLKQLLVENTVYRQEDLVNLMAQRGIEVTQATISRDIKQLQLIKVPLNDGSYRYTLPSEKEVDTTMKLKKTLQDAFVDADIHNEMCVLKVQPGNGPTVSSLIEQVDYPEIFACISDDDTVMIFNRSTQGAVKIQDKLETMASEN
ncbi:arginine repressor [Ligilactobacillus pobuzihii]|uniref:Arginine repressor n=1 Tax=Ligilactobacillus pobuzihii TaxID=449659 RepID=A0A0R2LS57_9LACO|nr:ArgR family transcriptional regulator [Ligilactobacillus pobuzihii]KRK11512.1 arginine repressor [Ligilactobacillus pobuzihii E100301 = KCTC 13174]KRO02827.1 arginine repressor [Ligilactobacillus pobuzihii]GEN47220.1 arginine repressor [Ligilactobacillus pobuzihii]